MTGVWFPSGVGNFLFALGPDRIRGSSNCLSSGYRRSIPGGKTGRAWSWPIIST